jgi:hypothetical protein
MRVTRWDANVLSRAALIATLALALAWLVTAATDEGGVAWGERAGRTLPLTPFCAAIGAWGALAAVRARGEALALEAIGRSPVQIAMAAVVGGAVVALAAAAAIGGVPSVDIAGFYPTAAHRGAWQWNGGDFVDVVQGLRVAMDGAPVRLAGEAEWRRVTTIPLHGRAAAALETALAGVALPMAVGRALLAFPEPAQRARERVATAVASAVTVACSVGLFQAAAARRLPAVLAAVPPAALLAFAVWRYRGTR